MADVINTDNRDRMLSSFGVTRVCRSLSAPSIHSFNHPHMCTYTCHMFLPERLLKGQGVEMQGTVPMHHHPSGGGSMMPQSPRVQQGVWPLSKRSRPLNEWV